MPGTNTLSAEVTSVSRYCIWIRINDEELALPYSEFPWFKAATIQQIITILQPTSGHLYWPDLDIDFSVESIRNPERFPLRARSSLSTTKICACKKQGTGTVSRHCTDCPKAPSPSSSNRAFLPQKRIIGIAHRAR